MKSKQGKFVLLITSVVIVVAVLGFFITKQDTAPSKYDDFAKALKTEGAQFFGAFWCPHCLAQKVSFGKAKQYLPYVECSNPDKSPTQICKDNKIESYPSWKFKNGISLMSKSKPIICDVKPGKTGEAPICVKVASQFYKTWIFPEYEFSVKSPTAPSIKDDVWRFENNAMTQGEIPLTFLAQQIGYTTLPQ